MYPRNAASPPRIAVGPVVQISDGAVQTTGVSVVVQPEGGSESAGGGTIAYSAASNSILYTPTQAETNYTAFVVTAYKTGCIPAATTIVTSANATAGKAQIGGIDADAITAASIQNNALTAAKFAAGAFDAVWTVTTRTLSSFGTLVSDVWSAATRRLTDSTLSGGGTIATAADIAGITQAQRVRLILPLQIERPDSGSTTYRLYIYAYDATHIAEDLDSNPTVTVENAAGTDRSSNLGTVTKPTGTGIYYVDYTLSVGDAIEQLIFQVTATEGAVATEYATTTQVVDTTAVDFTATDRANLALILEDTGTTLPATLATTSQLNARTLLAAEYATVANQTTILSNIAALPAAVWAIATDTLTTAGTIGKLIVDQFFAVIAAIAGIEGGEGSGANTLTITVNDTDGYPLETISVRRTKGADTRSRSTDVAGQTVFNLDAGSWVLSAAESGLYSLSGASGTGVTFDAATQTATVVISGTGAQAVTLVMTAISLSVPESPRIRARLLVLDANSKQGKPNVSLEIVQTGQAAANGYGSEVLPRTIVSNAGGLAEWYALPGETYSITGPNGVAHSVQIAKSAVDPYDVPSITV